MYINEPLNIKKNWGVCGAARGTAAGGTAAGGAQPHTHPNFFIFNGLFLYIFLYKKWDGAPRKKKKEKTRVKIKK